MASAYESAPNSYAYGIGIGCHISHASWLPLCQDVTVAIQHVPTQDVKTTDMVHTAIVSIRVTRAFSCL